MGEFTRRDTLKTLGAGAAVAAAPALLLPSSAYANVEFKPERGASIRLMRWRRFIQADEDQWLANTARFTQATGVQVRVDNEGFEDVRPKAAMAANVGTGPDIVLGWMDDPHLFEQRVIDVTDLAEYLGQKYGGWYPTARRYGSVNSGPNKGRWLGLPVGAGGALLNYRISWTKEAGFDKFPTDFDSYLKLCKQLSKNGRPPGFALSHATGDAETWSHNVLWGFGGRAVDENNRPAINSRETLAAIEYMTELYQTFIEGTLSWTGVSNNNSFLEERISLTSNGPSIYYVAKNSDDPRQRAIARDMDHAAYPIGPSGEVAELHLLSQAYVFAHTKFPNACKAYLQFMMEKEQYEPWQAAALSYMCPPLKAYAQTPFWNSDPKLAAFRDVVQRMRWSGFAGDVGEASAAALADWVIVDMFALAASRRRSPRDAVRDAERRLRRIYR
ncbi:MAG TPA: ABC transporter substrate-binding protein [Burkholderiales bacterium]|nr:ABC transporter substrate-binding protein [Burkholderiales bacterium]